MMTWRTTYRRMSVAGIFIVLCSSFFLPKLFGQAGQPAVMGAYQQMSGAMNNPGFAAAGQYPGAMMGNTNQPMFYGNANQNQSLADLFSSIEGVQEVKKPVIVYERHEGPVTNIQVSQTIMSLDPKQKANQKNQIQYSSSFGFFQEEAEQTPGYLVLSSSTDKTAQLWQLSEISDPATKKISYEVRQRRLFQNELNHKQGVTKAMFSPDEYYVLTASYDRSIRLWNSKIENMRSYLGSKDRVWAFDVDAEGQVVVAACNDGHLNIWQTLPPKKLGQLSISPTDEGKNIPIYDVHFDSTGEYVVSANADGTVRLWYVPSILEKKFFNSRYANIENADEEKKEEETEEGNVLTSLMSSNVDEFTEQFKKQQETLKKNKPTEYGECLTIHGHSVDENGNLSETPYVYSALFSGDDQYILTAGHDKTARIWSAFSGEELCRFVGHTGAVRQAKFVSNYVLTASDDGTVRIWSYGTNSSQNPNAMGGYSAGPAGMQNQPGGNRAGNQRYNNNQNMRAPGRRGPVGLPQAGAPIPAAGAAPTTMGMGGIPISSELATGVNTNSGQGNMANAMAPIRELGRNKGTELVRFKVEKEGVAVYCVDITPDGFYVLGGCSDGLIRVWQNPFFDFSQEKAAGGESWGYGTFGKRFSEKERDAQKTDNQSDMNGQQ